MFIDDPRAVNENGKYYSNYSNEPVQIGKKMTIEEAQKMWWRDMSKENCWGKSRKHSNFNRSKAI